MTDVVNVKPPRVSSSPSVPKHKQGERGRDTPLVLAENGDASATSLASAGGGGGGRYAPAQPDSLAVKSPPSPRPHRPNLPPFQQVDHWREEGEIRTPSPHSERGREEGERGTDRSRASDFHNGFKRRSSPSGNRSRPCGRDRYSSPARPQSPSLQSRPAENLSIHWGLVRLYDEPTRLSGHRAHPLDRPVPPQFLRQLRLAAG